MILLALLSFEMLREGVVAPLRFLISLRCGEAVQSPCLRLILRATLPILEHDAEAWRVDGSLDLDSEFQHLPKGFRWLEA